MPLGFPGLQQVDPRIAREGMSRFFLQAGLPLLGVQASYDPGAAIGAGLGAGMQAYDQYIAYAQQLKRQQEMDQMRRDEMAMRQQQMDALTARSEREGMLFERDMERDSEQRMRNKVFATRISRDLDEWFAENESSAPREALVAMEMAREMAETDPMKAREIFMEVEGQAGSLEKMRGGLDQLGSFFSSMGAPELAPQIISLVESGIMSPQQAVNFGHQIYAANKKAKDLPIGNMLSMAFNLAKAHIESIEATNEQRILKQLNPLPVPKYITFDPETKRPNGGLMFSYLNDVIGPMFESQGYSFDAVGSGPETEPPPKDPPPKTPPPAAQPAAPTEDSSVIDRLTGGIGNVWQDMTQGVSDIYSGFRGDEPVGPTDEEIAESIRIASQRDPKLLERAKQRVGSLDKYPSQEYYNRALYKAIKEITGLHNLLPRYNR